MKTYLIKRIFVAVIFLILMDNSSWARMGGGSFQGRNGDTGTYQRDCLFSQAHTAVLPPGRMPTVRAVPIPRMRYGIGVLARAHTLLLPQASMAIRSIPVVQCRKIVQVITQGSIP